MRAAVSYVGGEGRITLHAPDRADRGAKRGLRGYVKCLLAKALR